MNTPRTSTTPAWAIVTKREILVQLTDKAFWIGTILTLVLAAAGFGMVQLLDGGFGTTKVAVASDDAAAVVAIAADQGNNVEALRLPADQLEAAVKDGRASAALAHDDSGWSLSVQDPRNAPSALADIVRNYQLQANAKQLGVPLDQLTAQSTLRLVSLSTQDDSGSAVVIASLAFSILFMIAVMSYGMQIAQSVTTEKESRIVEILAAAIPIRDLLIGKVLGNSIMALGQVILFVGAALVSLSFTDYAPLISTIAPVAGWFIVFFIVGFAALACLWAAAGAMATRIQDLSQTTTPLTMLVMLVYMLGFVASGTTAKVLSYVPIASTVLLPGRLLSGEANWVDAALALLAALAFMAVAVWFGAKIYRRGLMQTNSVMSFKEALIGR